MGLAYNANEAIQIPNSKHEMLEEAKRIIREDESLSDQETEAATPAKSHVTKKLEAEAKVPRVRLLKLPKGQAQFFTYLIKRYGEDYEVRCSLEEKSHFNNQIIFKISNYSYIYIFFCAGNVER